MEVVSYLLFFVAVHF